MFNYKEVQHPLLLKTCEQEHPTPLSIRSPFFWSHKSICLEKLCWNYCFDKENAEQPKQLNIKTLKHAYLLEYFHKFWYTSPKKGFFIQYRLQTLNTITITLILMVTEMEICGPRIFDDCNIHPNDDRWSSSLNNSIPILKRQ